jgi:hypothetical protein
MMLHHGPGKADYSYHSTKYCAKSKRKKRKPFLLFPRYCFDAERRGGLVVQGRRHGCEWYVILNIMGTIERKDEMVWETP